MNGFGATGVTGPAPPQAPKPHSVWNAAGFKKGPAEAFRGHETDESLADGLDGGEDANVEDANVLQFPKPQAKADIAGTIDAGDVAAPAAEKQESAQPPNQPDAAAAISCLDSLFDKSKRLIISIKEGSIKACHFDADDRAGQKNFITTCGAAAYNIYFGLSPTKGTLHKKAAKNDVAEVRFLWVDLDPRPGKPLESERAVMLALLTTNLPPGIPRPSRIIDSGRGYWGIWILETPQPVDGYGPLTEAVECYGRGIEQAFGDFADDCHNIDRIGRLPGTINTKTGKPARVLHEWSHDALHAIEDFPRATEKLKKRGAPNTPGLTNGRAKAFADAGALANDKLSDGLEANIEEIRSAVVAIPPSAISTEPEWEDFARMFAHEAARFPKNREVLEQILDTVSRAALGYDAENNRERFQRYIDEAFDRETPLTIRSVFKMALDHGWQGWSPSMTPAALPAVTWSAAELKVSFSNIRHRRWLYGTYLIRGEITVLAAPGGAGKTALATGMAVEIAAGAALLDENIFGNDLKALFINGEDGSTEIRRRIWALCLAYAHKNVGQHLDRLYVAGSNDPHVQKLSFLRTANSTNSTLDVSGFKILESALDALRPDVLILDPLVAFCGGGNMNDNSVMSQVMRELKRLAAMFDCAILVVHHTRKGRTANDEPAGEAERISGAAAIVNLARRALMPVTMSETEAKLYSVLPSQRYQFFKLVDAKSNLAPLSAQAPWYELASVELPNSEPPTYPNGDRVQAVKRAHLTGKKATSSLGSEQRAIRFELMKLIERGLLIESEKAPYSPNSTGNNKKRAILADAMAAIEKALPEREWLPRDLRATVERELEAIKHDGWVIVEKIKNGRFRRSHGLRPAWERTPWAKERESLQQHGGPTIRTEEEKQQLDESDTRDSIEKAFGPNG